MLVRLLHLLYLVFRYKCFFLLIPFLYDKKSRLQAKRLVLFLENAGSSFIKLGQLLSTRVDFFGDQYIEELNRLKDKTSTKRSINLKKLIQDEFDDSYNNIFEYIDFQPVSSASIAYVYKGVLKDSKEDVAIKVVKPFIHKNIKKDLKIIAFLFKLSELVIPRAKIIRPTKLIKILKETVNKELDLRIEASHLDQISDNFKDNNHLYFPKVYWQYVSKNILVEEWVNGKSIQDIEHYSTSEKEEIMKNFSQAFFMQIIRDGFFHGDIHQGNILINEKKQIVFLDFGMMGFLDNKLRIYLYELFYAFLNKNYQRAAQIHFDLGWISKDFKVEDFALYCRLISEKVMSVRQQDISIGKLLSDLFQVSGIFKMEVQENLMLLQKNLVYFENLGRQLTPEKNMWLFSRDIINKQIKNSAKYKQQLQKTGLYIKDEILFLKENFIEITQLQKQLINIQISNKRFGVILILFVILMFVYLIYIN